nr:MAG TPA: hypothetical protein [Bacteriophage sp.]
MIARFVCTLFVLSFILFCAFAGNVNVDFIGFYNVMQR